MTDESPVVDEELLVFKHDNGTGVMGWLSSILLPHRSGVLFVWPDLAHELEGLNYKRWRYGLLAVLFLGFTAGLIMLLAQVPALRVSVVSLLGLLFGVVLPAPWNMVAAWVLGIFLVFRLGSIATMNWLQHALNSLPSGGGWYYDFWLKMAIYEELLFRAGSEKWSWLQRLRAGMFFGLIHITNIWYSLAAGIALSVTGLLFMAVYLYVHNRTGCQIRATAASSVVHAMYNMIAVSLVLVLVLVPLVLQFV